MLSVLFLFFVTNESNTLFLGCFFFIAKRGHDYQIKSVKSGLQMYYAEVGKAINSID